MTIYLIRHGKTEANEQHLYCGSTDIGLSEAGKEALRKLNYPVPKADFVTSGMRRTNETLALLFPGVTFRTEPSFREVDFGEFEMRSYQQLKEDPAYLRWITGENERNVPPRGESGEMMEKRVLETLALIREDTVIVTHGGVIAAIMAHLFPEEGKNRYQWQPAPGYGYAITDGHYKPIP